jgi:hypothetical protein
MNTKATLFPRAAFWAPLVSVSLELEVTDEEVAFAFIADSGSMR